MTVNTRPITGSSAAALGEYYAPEIAIGLYYAETDGGTEVRSQRVKPGPETVIWEAHEVHGAAATRLGIAPGAPVTMADLHKIMARQHAKTGEQLTKLRAAPVYKRDPARPKEYLLDADGKKIRALDDKGKPLSSTDGATQGVEMVTAACKSFGIAMVVAPPAVRAAMNKILDRADAAAMAHVQATAPLGRMSVRTPTARAAAAQAAAGDGSVMTKPATLKQGSDTVRVPLELVMMTKRQYTARPVDGRELADVHPHTHIFIGPCGWDPATEQWRTLDEYGLMEKHKATEVAALWAAEVHRGLVDLGFTMRYEDFDRDRDGRVRWEIDGITPEAIEFFSRNAARVTEVVARHEAETGRVASTQTIHKLMHETKGHKDPATARQDVSPDWSLWSDLAEREGITLATEELVEAMAHMLDKTQPVERAPYEERRRELFRRVFDSPNGLTRKNAVFTSPEVLATVARCSENLDFTDDERATLNLEILNETVALQEVDAEGNHLAHDKIKRTTRQQLVTELRLDAELQRKSKTRYPRATPEAAEAAITAAPHPLDDEQRLAFDALTSDAGLVFLEGDAGTGKTTALRPAADALRASGVVDRVYVVSTAGRTGIETGEKLRADAHGSIDSIVSRIEQGTLKVTPKTLFIADESAMIDTRRAAQLVAASKGARMWLAGDPEQSRPIGASGWYQDATKRRPELVHRLTNVHRYADVEDEKATRALREGRADEALDSFAKRGRLHIGETGQDSLNSMVDDYRTYRDKGYSALEVRIVNVGGSNHEIDNTNRAIQADRIAAGEIPARGFAMTEQSTGRAWTLHGGDPVLFIQAHRAGAASDRVRNGVGGVARSVDPDTGRAVIDLHDGRAVTLDLAASRPLQPVTPAYAVHSLRFQGAQTKISLARPAAPEQVDKNTGYVGFTRAEHEVHIYLDHETHGTDAVANMARALRESSHTVSAMSLHEDYKPRHAAPTPPPASAVATVTTANDASRGRREKAEQDRASRLSAARDRARDEMRLAVIARSRGSKAADRVYESPSWSKLKANLNDLEARGLDDRAMLHLAARKGDFDGAHDYAAVLSGRLDDVRRSHSIPRTRPEPAERGPAVNYLVGPADRGPKRPSLLDADTMHDLTRAAGPHGDDPMTRPDYEPRHAGRSRDGAHHGDYEPRHAAQGRQNGSDRWSLEKYRVDYARRQAEAEQTRAEDQGRDRGMDIGF